MKKDHSRQSLKRFLKSLDDESLFRFYYCYEIGSTFVVLGKMERTIIHAMGMCDRIKVFEVLGSDAKTWDGYIQKHNKLQDSTLGNLIKILAKHSTLDSDLKYLRWLKEKRDFFIHRWFRNELWPGEMTVEECRIMVRRLLYLEIIFDRASAQIWKILGRAGLIAVQDLGTDGYLMLNPDAMSEVFGDEWLEAAKAMTVSHIKNKRKRQKSS
jgi:hypothetical protein